MFREGTSRRLRTLRIDRAADEPRGGRPRNVRPRQAQTRGVQSRNLTGAPSIPAREATVGSTCLLERTLTGFNHYADCTCGWCVNYGRMSGSERRRLESDMRRRDAVRELKLASARSISGCYVNP